MRLLCYLNEESLNITLDDMITLIKKDCKPFLKEFGDYKSTPLYRGIKSSEMFIRKDVRNDRTPLDMAPEVSKLLNNLFKERFGWYPRTEGVFCTKDELTTRKYGSTYMVFPIGSYKYLYSDTILDLITLKLDSFEEDDDIYEFLSNNYKTTGLSKSETKSEIMIKCNSYYAIKYNDDGNTNYMIRSKLGIKA